MATDLVINKAAMDFVYGYYASHVLDDDITLDCARMHLYDAVVFFLMCARLASQAFDFDLSDLAYEYCADAYRFFEEAFG